MFADAWRIGGAREELNYGCDRLRFLSPVRAGSKVRVKCVLKHVEERASGLLTTTAVTAEIEGEARPALVADWLSLYKF